MVLTWGYDIPVFLVGAARRVLGGGRSGPYRNSSGYGRFRLMYSCTLGNGGQSTRKTDGKCSQPFHDSHHRITFGVIHDPQSEIDHPPFLRLVKLMEVGNVIDRVEVMSNFARGCGWNRC